MVVEAGNFFPRINLYSMKTEVLCASESPGAQGHCAMIPTSWLPRWRKEKSNDYNRWRIPSSIFITHFTQSVCKNQTLWNIFEPLSESASWNKMYYARATNHETGEEAKKELERNLQRKIKFWSGPLSILQEGENGYKRIYWESRTWPPVISSWENLHIVH